MLPKIIHYCWFGHNPLPMSALKCIESWKFFFPDYEIKEWNEDNFDVNIIPYTSEAYEAKKYAFVSDYARFWVLYKYGGLYFDTDVEVIKSMDDIIAKGPFMGAEKAYDPSKAGEKMSGVAPGLGLGCNPGQGLIKEILDAYTQFCFINPDGSLNKKTVVDYTTEILCNHGLLNTAEIQECGGFRIYPQEYFAPKDVTTGILTITPNTRSIHHYDASWHTASDKLKERIAKMMGSKLRSLILSIKHRS